MANNYTQFAASVGKLTAKEKKWWDRLLGLETFWDEKESHRNVKKIAKILEVAEEAIFDASWPPFDYQYIRKEKTLYFSSSGSGDPYYLSLTISAFFRKFRPDDVYDFEAAFTCSKDREGEIGGCRYIITANGVYTSHQVMNELARLILGGGTIRTAKLADNISVTFRRKR